MTTSQLCYKTPQTHLLVSCGKIQVCCYVIIYKNTVYSCSCVGWHGKRNNIMSFSIVFYFLETKILKLLKSGLKTSKFQLGHGSFLTEQNIENMYFKDIANLVKNTAWYLQAQKSLFILFQLTAQWFSQCCRKAHLYFLNF